MSEPRILLVEDDPDIVDLVTDMLTKEGYAVSVCKNGAVAVDVFSEIRPHLVLLDLGLPGLDGIGVCRRIREIADTAIIIVSARSSTESHVDGLDAGADDYVTKPFKRDELLARIRSQLRRIPQENDAHSGIGDVVVDHKAHMASRGGRDLELTKGEYRMLAYLVEHQGEAISRDELLREVWGWEGADQTTNTVDMFVSNLRKKMEADGEPRILKTRHGVGYLIEG